MGGRSGQSVLSTSNAVLTYQSTAFDAINNELRYDVPDKYKDVINKLDGASVDKESGVLYRGVDSAFVSELMNKYGLTRGSDLDTIKSKLIGTTFSDKGFQSATNSLSVASFFSRDKGNGLGSVFQIEGTKTGINISKYLKNFKSKQENEFIIKRNSRFRITNVGYSKSGRLILYLQSI